MAVYMHQNAPVKNEAGFDRLFWSLRALGRVYCSLGQIVGSALGET
jgi:hypothetical protein